MSHKRAKTARVEQRARERSRMQETFTAFIGYLRGIYKRRAGPMYQEGPDLPRPCHTCALNPGTDRWQGFDSTMMRLEAALARGEVFYCHEGLPRDRNGDWTWDGKSPIEPCAGWLVIRDAPDARHAYTRAILGDEVFAALSPESLAFLDERMEAFRELSGGRAIICDIPEWAG